jgi:hypothetical protein
MFTWSFVRALCIPLFLCVLIGGCAKKPGSAASSKAQELPLCEGSFDFSSDSWITEDAITGFSHVEPTGKWTDGNEASFTCSLPPGNKQQPSTVLIATVGFVYAGHSQRAIISINGSKATEERYDVAEPRVIELPLPSTPGGKLNIKFSLPDAVSPQQLGLNPDQRKIAIRVRSIEFK